MSRVTLDSAYRHYASLYQADFDNRVERGIYRQQEILIGEPDSLLRHYEELDDRTPGETAWAIAENPILASLLEAAHTYIIARDYGLCAARGYKLSDGRLDPRKP